MSENLDSVTSFDRIDSVYLETSQHSSLLKSNVYKSKTLTEQTNKITNKSNFEELNIVKTNIDISNISDNIPILRVEDSSEKKDLYYFINFSIGNYKTYEISIINYNNIEGGKKILCFRRYKNFNVLHQRLSDKYSSYIIPKLIEKSYTNKILNKDEDFYITRKKQLNYYINYLYDHHFLKNTEEFKKFITDPEFDEYFFNKNDYQLNLIESEKFSEKLTNKLYGLITYFKPTVEDNYKKSENELKIDDYEFYYQNIFDEFKKLQTNFVF